MEVVNQGNSSRPQTPTIIVNLTIKLNALHWRLYVHTHLNNVVSFKRKFIKIKPSPAPAVNKMLQCTSMSSQHQPIRPAGFTPPRPPQDKKWLNSFACHCSGCIGWRRVYLFFPHRGHRSPPTTTVPRFVITFTAAKVYKVKDEASSGSSSDKCLTSNF